MERIPHGSSFSVRRFRWVLVKAAGDGKRKEEGKVAPADDDVIFAVSRACDDGDREGAEEAERRKKAPGVGSSSSVSSRFRAAVAGWLRPVGLGPRVTGTLFGRRRGGGHVHVAFQADPRACPAVLIELATPTSALVREMASGLVRIALECDRRCRRPSGAEGKKQQQLVEEPLWRAYCNGKRCGYAVRRECGPADWRVLRAVEPVSTGAGVLPAASSAGEAGETMYLRAKFERVVGSRDSEAFYMMNPDNDGGPELSIYFLRL